MEEQVEEPKKRNPGRFAKGKENRQLADVLPILNDWWPCAVPFKKMPASGALRWNTGHFTFGDIVPPESCPFVFECKNHEEIEMDAVLRNPWDQNKLTWFWYGQTVRDSIRATEALKRTMYPLMIYKIAKNVNRVVLQADMWDRFPKELTSSIRHIRIHLPVATDFIVAPLTFHLERKTKAYHPGFVQQITRKVVEQYVLGIQPISQNAS